LKRESHIPQVSFPDPFKPHRARPALTIPFLILTLIVLGALGFFWSRRRRVMRAKFIRGYLFPAGLLDKLGAKRPQLELKDRQLVARGLRQFFLAYLKSGRQFVSMPSQVADDLWHEFILYTRHYEAFCKQAFGRYLHHTPTAVLGPDRRDNAGLRRTWWYACLEENIHPRHPPRLPLLFALDAKFNIPDGFRYTPDCAALREGGGGGLYCGGDFSSSNIDGSVDGFGDSGGGEGGGCDGGCGGD
jgi:hypothetical protein